MASVRMPLIVAVPLVIIGGGALLVNKLTKAVAGPSDLVFIAEAPITVEVRAEDGALRTLTLRAGQHERVSVSRGTHSVRFPSNPTAAPTSVSVGADEMWLVPTAPDQCFATVDLGNLYGRSNGAVVQNRLSSPPARVDHDVRVTKGELKGRVMKDESAVVVDALPCSQLSSMNDTAIVAAISAGSTAAQGERALAQGERAVAKTELADEMAEPAGRLVVSQITRGIEREGWKKTAEVGNVFVFQAADRFALYDKKVLQGAFQGFPSAKASDEQVPNIARAFVAAATAKSREDNAARPGIFSREMLTLASRQELLPSGAGAPVEAATSFMVSLGPENAPLAARLGFRDASRTFVPLTPELASALALDEATALRQAKENGPSKYQREAIERCLEALRRLPFNSCGMDTDASTVLVASIERFFPNDVTLDINVADDGVLFSKVKAGDPATKPARPGFFGARLVRNGKTTKWLALKP